MFCSTRNLRCGLCGEEAPSVVACAGNNCEAVVGNCCLGHAGFCRECEREGQHWRPSSRQQTAAYLRMLASEVTRGWTSDEVAEAAAALVARWQREVREEQR